MPRNPTGSIEKNFVKGYVTEATGLNFPENACTETDNCVFDRTGNAHRRTGIDYESSYTLTNIDRDGYAITDFKWKNAGGDGVTEVYVLQVGPTLYFYETSASTIASPLSAQKLASTVTLSDFSPTSAPAPDTYECQYASGQGYLFVFHPYLEPFYCTYSSGTITATLITIRERDFKGVDDGLDDDYRPLTLLPPGTLSDDLHNYNLQNQGWGTSSAGWSTTSTTSNNTNIGAHTWTVDTGLSITGGDLVDIGGTAPIAGGGPLKETGSVTSYVTDQLTIAVSTTNYPGYTVSNWTFDKASSDKLDTWNTDVGNYPSNSDVWWYFKDSAGDFSPATQLPNVIAHGLAPKGHFILDSFNKLRTNVSGLSTLTSYDETTTFRPTTGAWFQGRVWYSGINADTFTESIYFSQVIDRPDQFGKCYQVNDPTDEQFFDLLPTDGGVIKIQGCDSIKKLFPIQNGILVFADNGIWFITGSQGLGFVANDYTVTKISSVKTLSANSFVDVKGYPIWWNEEGIQTIVSSQQGLDVKDLTLDTIASYYSDVPLISKLYARGDYNPLSYRIQWVFRSIATSSVTTRYEYDKILNLDVRTGAFYLWTFAGTPKIHDVKFITYPGSTSAPDAKFLYLTSATDGAGSYNFTMSEMQNFSYKDWFSYTGTGDDYTSSFVTGYKIHGQGQRDFQSTYVYIYNQGTGQYQIQGLWGFANTSGSGRWSTAQSLNHSDSSYDYSFKRVKLRGRGQSLQIKITSVSGQPFNIIGWSIFETVNQWV